MTPDTELLQQSSLLLKSDLVKKVTRSVEEAQQLRTLTLAPAFLAPAWPRLPTGNIPKKGRKEISA